LRSKNIEGDIQIAAGKIFFFLKNSEFTVREMMTLRVNYPISGRVDGECTLKKISYGGFYAFQFLFLVNFCYIEINGVTGLKFNLGSCNL